MTNHWGRQPNFKIPPLAICLIVIGIIIFALFPNIFTNPLANSTSAPASSDNISLPESNNSNSLNSSDIASQIPPSAQNNSVSSGNGEIASGYWILFIDNGILQQLSISSQDYVFLQSLVSSDTKGTPTAPIFLVENGQIQKHVVSNEINLIISNLAAIYKRSSSQTSSNSSTTTPNTSDSADTSSSTPSTSNSNASSSNTTNSNTSSSNASSSNTSSSNASSSNTTNSGN